MQKLHLVGFTTDQRGLIFSVRRGAKSGGYVIALDETLLSAVEELRAFVAEEEAAAAASAEAMLPRPESTLSVREVQARLRRGRTLEQVAREAGVDREWVSRFAAPVLAEQAEIVRAARATRMTKQRVGLSGATLADSVYRNLADRGVTDPRDQLDKGWRALQLTEGVWLVTFSYTVRGREAEAEWEYDETNGLLRSRGRLGTSLGYREGRRPRSTSTSSSSSSSSSKGAAPKSAPAKVTTARQSSSRQATKRVAAARRAAVARMASEAERATKRNAAAVRKAAKKPLIIPPRIFERVLEPVPPLEPEDVEDEPEEVDEVDEFDAQTDAEDATEATEERVEDIDEGDLEDEESHEAEDAEEFVGEADESEPEEPEAAPPQPRRREPLRARTRRVEESFTSPAQQARAHVEVRAAAAHEPTTGNGPVFRRDLAQPAAHPPGSGPTPELPLPAPLAPIEPPPRRRRLRPLRGR